MPIWILGSDESFDDSRITAYGKNERYSQSQVAAVRFDKQVFKNKDERVSEGADVEFDLPIRSKRLVGTDRRNSVEVANPAARKKRGI